MSGVFKTFALALFFVIFTQFGVVAEDAVGKDGVAKGEEGDKGKAEGDVKDAKGAEENKDEKGADGDKGNKDVKGVDGGKGDAKAVGSAARKAICGNFKQFVLSSRMFKKSKDYFKKALGDKDYFKFYERFVQCANRRNREMRSPSKYLEYNLEDKKAMVIVPKTYKDTEAWGVFLHISDFEAPKPSEEWLKLLAERKLIFVSPWDTGFNKPDVERIGVALDSLATVQSVYNIDSKRIYLSGTGTGAGIASLLLLNYPKMFAAVISNDHSLVLKDTNYGEDWLAKLRRESLPDDVTFEEWLNEAPYIKPKDHKKVLRRKPRLVFYTGRRDGEAHERVLRGSFTWDAFKYKTLIIDAPMENKFEMSEKWLKVALDWIEKKDVDYNKIPQPRYDMYRIRKADKNGR